ncbi:glycosyltransferase family 4 protein [Spirosoma validum]|uniref:Glycosyltransferase family 4 protein n=1 Tax=Spirosoma validum TaxID=2771355 RepID=A0A927GF01_9BACT|nr:glycosyltransferase family 4 protein [Spirosoma validum]MBD2755334.1 glycosyltransferase family 4 protein [Spirosoma validum]
MRILIVHNILWAHYKASVFQALQQLVDQQTDVTVKVLQIARNERSRADLETASDVGTLVYAYDYDLLFDRFLEDISLRSRTRSLLQRAGAFKPDVILLTGYYDFAQIFLLLWAKAKGIRVVMQNESTLADQRQGGWKEQFKRRIFSLCDGFFCFGTQSANYLIQLGVPPEKILLRKNAVDNDALRVAYEEALPKRVQEQQRLSVRPNNFIFVGRLITFKNLQTLLTAFADANEKSSNAQEWGLILLGDGPEKVSLQQQADELGLIDSVQFMSGRPWFQVPDVLALGNVLVLPSWSEPWGLVVNEALVCGLPVIVSNRCGCVPDLVHDKENGFVFDPAQPDQLTDLLLRFMDDKVDLGQLSESARQSVIPYSPKAVALGMLNGFRKVSQSKVTQTAQNQH